MSTLHFFAKDCSSEWGGEIVWDRSSLGPWMDRWGINHLISRESTMDIGVGDRHPNSGREEANAKEKDFSKSWKEFCCTSKSNLSQIFNQGKGQSHYKTLQIVQKEKEWLCLKFWPFEASIYVKEIYSKLQKDFHKTNEQCCWKGKQYKLNLVGVIDCMYHQWKCEEQYSRFQCVLLNFLKTVF